MTEQSGYRLTALQVPWGQTPRAGRALAGVCYRYGVANWLYPPAIAPTTRNGSAPDATASGSGASGGSCDEILLAGEEPHERPARLASRGRGSSRAASG